VADLKRYILDNVDAAEVYKDLIPEWREGSNISCPFAESRHKRGTDSSPSMSIDLDKGIFCHACGYKASSFIGFWEDLNGVTFEKALADIYNSYVRQLVSAKEVRKVSKDLLDNPFILGQLFKVRGINKDTVKRWNLGWKADRLWIPIRNEYGLYVNVRKHDIFKRFDSKLKIVSYGKGFGDSRLWPLDSIKGKIIFLLEGELDTLLALQNELNALTVAGSGAMTWKSAWGKLFKGKSVAIVPDNDKTGMDGAKKRQLSIQAGGGKAAIIELPVKEEGEDLTDWFLHYSGTADDLMSIAKKALKETDKPRQSGGNADFSDTTELLNDTLTPREAMMLERAEIVFNSMMERGVFFRGVDNSLYYSTPNKKVLHVAMTSPRFLSFMNNISPLINPANSNGKFILQHVISRGFMSGKKVVTGAWSLYSNGSIYLFESNNNLIKVSHNAMEKVPNAVNDDAILIETPSEKMMFKFNAKVPVAEGMRLLWRYYAENLALKTSDRYLMLCWLLGVFFREYVRAKPLVRLLARTAWGKSTASKLTSFLIYGDEFLSHSASTIAASYEMSRTHPLLLFDNIETRNMTPTFEDFMLITATGGLKAKRQRATDIGIVVDSTNCLLLSNGIEPFSKRELISRTIELNLDLEKYGKDPFHEVKEFKQLLSSRSTILSAIVKVARAHILPSLYSGETAKIINYLPEHSKERFNAYISVMAIILKALWRYIPADEFSDPMELILEWLHSQDISTQAQDSQTNEVLYFLNTLIERYTIVADFKVKLKEENSKVLFNVTTQELLSDFRILARHLGIRCPWDNERQLGTRLVDAMDILEENSWKREKTIMSGRIKYKYTFIRRPINAG